MIEFLSDAPGHLIAVRVSGRVGGDDLDRFAERLDRAFDAHEEVSLFLEVKSLEGVSPKAVLKDVRTGLRHVQNLYRLHRAAIVTGQEWIRTGVGWENRLLQGIELRAFAPPEREEALAWAGEMPPRAGEGAARGLEEILTKDDATLAFAVKGPVTGADIEAITPKMSAAYDAHGSVNLMMRMDARYRFRLDVFSEPVTEMKTEALGHVERYAIVGAPAWVERIAGLLAPLLKPDVRFFRGEEEAAAWDWLGTEPGEMPADAGS